MVPEPVASFAANSASRSEMPSDPGLAISAHGLDVSPLTMSLLFETTKLGQLCCATACRAIIVASRQIIVAIVRIAAPQAIDRAAHGCAACRPSMHRDRPRHRQKPEPTKRPWQFPSAGSAATRLRQPYARAVHAESNVIMTSPLAKTRPR